MQAQSKCVLYAAKSTEDVRGSIPTQLEDGRKKAEQEGWEVVAEYQDEGFSAYSGNRGPGLQRARQHAAEIAEQEGACILVAQHSDRFARGAGDSPDAAEHLVEVLTWANRHAVALRTVQDDMFSDPRFGLVMAAMMGQRNTEDSRRKSEATKAGLKRRVERGYFNGPPPYGYDYAAEGTLAIVKAEAPIVRRILNEFVAGQSFTAIAAGLERDGVPTKKGVARWKQATVSAMVRNPVYIGKVKNKGRVFDGVHEAIIDQELWDRAAQLVAAQPTKRGRPPKKKRHLFTGGFLRCGNCGDSLSPRTRRNYEYYECNGRIHGCKVGAIKRATVDEPVLRYFEQVGLDIEATREQLADAKSRKVAEIRALLAAAQMEAQAAHERLERIRGDYKSGELPAKHWLEFQAELEPQAEAADAEVERLAAQAAEIEKGPDLGDTETEVLEKLMQIRQAIAGEIQDAEGIAAVRATLQRLFDKFILHPGMPKQAHVELLTPGFWIEPVVSESAVADYDEKMRPVLRREPLGQAANNYNQASGCL